MSKEIRSASGSAVGPESLVVSDGRSKRHVALAAAALLVVAGVVGSVLGANAVARSASAKSALAFNASSNVIASTLELAIQHEQDLVVGAGGFIAENPNATNSQLIQWSKSERMLQRYPELVSLFYVAYVPAAELPNFTARAAADPLGPLSANGTFQVTPPGSRSFYCLLAGETARVPNTIPAGFDYCASSETGSLFRSARDSNQAGYQPYTVNKLPELVIDTTMYRGAVAPATVAGRRAAFLGVIGTVILPKVVLDRSLKGHYGYSVSFRYHAGSSNVAFSSGTPPVGAQSAKVPLHNGWTVTTFANVANGGLFADRSALALLLTGIILSVLAGILSFVLVTGRTWALRLVGERTGELRYQSLHDSLTGLPNRALILDRIEQLLTRSRRQGTLGAALFVDLDNFKDVNDTLGHAAGDRLLVAVASRLEAALREADTIGRMGGDEFVVLIDGASLDAAPELVAERLLDVMHQPFELDEVSLPIIVNASVGIAMGDRANPEDLLRDADVALYQAKDAGKNRYEVFDPEVRTGISNRTELEFELRSALDDKQFRLVYQPIYNLDDLTFIGVEALLRWEHPTKGLIQPDRFIPILEQTGQIREVGRWALREACTQMAEWHAKGDILDVSVNVSGRQLDGDAIIAHLRDALESSGLPAASLIIEVTETALMRNPKATARRLAAIKELGVKVAIDDFGTGYSSLAYLRQFPVDCLKIDRMFTNAITTSPESKALIGTLVQLGRDLGLRTLAEGVETTGEMDRLKEEHVDEVQGFLFSRPLDAATIESQFLVPGRRPTTHSHR